MHLPSLLLPSGAFINLWTMVGRREEAKKPADELMAMLERGDDLGSMSPSTCYLNSGKVLHHQTSVLRNARDHQGAKISAQQCLDMMDRCADIRDHRRAEVVENVAYCLTVLGRRKEAKETLTSYLAEVEDSPLRNTDVHCRALNNLSIFYQGDDWEAGLSCARKAYIIGKLAWPQGQRYALSQIIGHLMKRGPEVDQYAELYSHVDKFCSFCRTAEDGKATLLDTIFNQKNSVGEVLLKDDARDLRAAALQNQYSDVFWALTKTDIELTYEELVIEAKKRGLGKQCAYCGKVARLKWCTGCRTVQYCGAPCQTADWEQHQHVCKMMKSKEKA